MKRIYLLIGIVTLSTIMSLTACNQKQKDDKVTTPVLEEKGTENPKNEDQS